jgi:hypothetical protein
VDDASALDVEFSDIKVEAGILGETSLSLLIAFALATAATSVPPLSPDVAALRAEADALLKKRDYVGLQNRVLAPRSQTEVQAFLDWGRDRWFEGNSAAVPFVHGRLLWSAAGDDARLAGLKDSAVGSLLYVLAVVRIDGTRCGDRTAPIDRYVKIVSAGREMLQYAATAGPEDRDQMITLAELVERRTAAVRDEKGDIDFVCRFGMEETTYNLRHGSARELPNKPGQIGRQVELSGDGNYRPSVRHDADWKPEAAKLRASMRADLEALLGTPATAK